MPNALIYYLDGNNAIKSTKTKNKKTENMRGRGNANFQITLLNNKNKPHFICEFIVCLFFFLISLACLLFYLQLSLGSHFSLLFSLSHTLTLFVE